MMIKPTASTLHLKIFFLFLASVYSNPIKANVSCKLLFSHQNLNQEKLFTKQAQTNKRTNTSLSNTVKDQNEQLSILRNQFGPELSFANEFQIELSTSRQAWHSYENFEILHLDYRNDFGQLIIRNDQNNYFFLDAHFPKARQIINEAILTNPPEGFHTSVNHRFFLIDTYKLDISPAKIPEGLLIEMNRSFTKIPTINTLNNLLKSELSKKDIEFIGVSNRNIDLKSRNFNKELAIHLAEGKIPILLDKNYLENTINAYRLMQAYTPKEWKQFRSTLSKFQDFYSNPSIIAGKRYEAEQLAKGAIAKLLYEIQGSELWWPQDSLFIRMNLNDYLLMLERELTQNSTASADSSGSYSLYSKLTLDNPSNYPSKYPTTQLITQPIKRFVQKYSNVVDGLKPKDKYDTAKTIFLSPEDLSLILNDRAFAKSFKNNDENVEYLRWLNSMITRSNDQSGFSISSQRIDLMIWIYRQYEKLSELEIPANLNEVDGAQWLTENIRNLLGSKILVERLSFEKVNSYDEKALDRYLNNLRKTGFAYEYNREFKYDPTSETKKLSEAYEQLEIGYGADLLTVKKAYRKLALRWHPDRNQTNLDESTAEMQKINTAYDLLYNHLNAAN